MSNIASSILERVYIQKQSAIRTIPNSSGTWTNTGAAYIRHDRVALKDNSSIIAPGYKTGTASALIGVNGRRNADMSLDVPIIPSGVAGTAPDMDPLLQGIFGQAPTITPSTKVAYTLSDSIIPLAAFIYSRAFSTNTQRYGFGFVPQSVTITLGGNGRLTMSVSAKGIATVNSDNFSGEDTTAKAGLTTFPAEPSPTTAGAIIPAFGGSVLFGGSATAEFRGAQISFTTGKDLTEDVYLDKYPYAAVQGYRSVVLRSLKFLDSDGAALTAVKNASVSKTPMDVTIPLGSIAGASMNFILKQVQFGAMALNDNGPTFDVDFDDSTAHATSVSNLNEFSLEFV